MTVEELQSVVVYLQDKIEKLEQKKMCECDTIDAEPEVIKPTVAYVTNYNEDDECLTCSA